MKEKKRDGDGATNRPRGSRKNIVGSESQGLLQAAAGSGFIGFSAFQSAPNASPAGKGDKTAAPSRRGGGDTVAGAGGGKRVKMGQGDGKYSAGGPGQVLPPHYSGGDSNLAVVSKRLSKRDVTTKIKALAGLRAMCRAVSADLGANSALSSPAFRGSPARDEAKAGSTGVSSPASPGDVMVTSVEALGGLAPHWVFLYQRLSTEGDRRTREAANTTLLCMIKANRKAFQPLMRSLLGAWWCSQADTATEVSTSAREAFFAVFPESKRASILGRYAGGVLRHIDSLLQQTPQTIEETSGCTADEAVKRAERLTVSALAALSNLIDAVGPEVNERLCRRDDDAIAADEDAGQNDQDATYWSILKESLWARLDDARPAVRRATYALVSACCRHTPGLLRPIPHLSTAESTGASGGRKGGDEEALLDVGGGSGTSDKDKGRGRAGAGMGGKGSRVATPALVIGLLSEKDASNHREAWQAVLLLLREFSDTWQTEKGAAMVLPTLLVRLRKGAFLPTSSTSYPCLLPLIASFSVETLLSPTTDSRFPGTPFCVALLETLWASMATPSKGSSAISAGLCVPNCLPDVVCAQIECVTFLLLKLPPSSGEGGTTGTLMEQHDGAVVDAGVKNMVDAAVETPGAGGSSVMTENLARAVRHFVLDSDAEEEGEGEAKEGLRQRIRHTGRGSMIVEAFGRALGQLHLGEARGAGVMVSAGGSAAVWAAVLGEFKGALDARSGGGIGWMGEALVHAVSTVKERQSGPDQEVRSARNGNIPDSSSGHPLERDGGGGLWGVCRTLFQHCAGAIGYVEKSAGEEEGVQGEISPADIPLLGLMSAVARVLGIANVFDSSDASRPAAENAGKTFYEKFLVPRLLASASSSPGDPSGTARVAMIPLKELVEMHLSATSGSTQEEHFRVLLTQALTLPEAVWLHTTTMVLRLAPPCLSRDFPDLEEAVLKACGLSTTTGTDSIPPPPSTKSLSATNSSDLPAFLQACLGVWGGRRAAAPFIGASVVSKMADVAVTVHDVAPGAVGGAVKPSAPAVTVATPGDVRNAVSMAVLEGLLGVLAVGESAVAAAATSPPAAAAPEDGTAGGNYDEAIASVREEGLRLLLSAFVGCGEGRVAGRLWTECGAPALAKLVSTPSSSGEEETAVREAGGQVILQAFLDGAVEHTRGVMEGGVDAGGGDIPVDEEAAERAATLALALVNLERSAAHRRSIERKPVPAAEGDDGADSQASSEETGSGRAPVLWRLGLTRPSVWQSRRAEAFGGVDTAAAATAVAADSTLAVADVARSCVSSRWARRWQCTLAILQRLPSARERLALLEEGVASGEEESGTAVAVAAAGRDSGAAGAMLQEIITAGVVVGRASGLLEGKGYGGLFVGGDGLTDLPQGLAIPSAPVTSVRDGRGAGGGAGDSVAGEFGVGLPSFRGLSGRLPQDEPTTIAAVAAAGVIDAALAYLGEDGAFRVVTPTAKDASRPSRRVAFKDTDADGPTHPFSLLFPRDLWRVAFEAPTPVAAGGGDKTKRAVVESGRDGKERGHALTGSEASATASAPAPPQSTTNSEDVRLHDLLVSALTSAVGAMAEDAGGGGGVGVSDGRGEVGAWRVSFSAEVSAGLLASVVGGAFMLGFGLGDEANRIMAIRCGTYDISTPTPADLVPGAKTLYTREGQAVTIVAAHVDQGGGDPYFTIRPLAAPGSAEPVTGQERQTVLNRLSLVPPTELSSSAVAASANAACPWLVRPAVASKLTAVIDGPLLAFETILWGALVRASGEDGPGGRALAAASAAALRGCASTCVRAALLCAGSGPDKESWEGVRVRVVAMRNRWASAAVKSGSTVVAAAMTTTGSDGGGASAGAAAAVALSASVLSGFFAGTPLMPSDEEGMRLMPARLKRALSEDVGSGLVVNESVAAALGWRRAQSLASLVWLRDSAEASCKVHLCPSPGSVDGGIFTETQAVTDAAVVALVGLAAAPCGSGGWVGRGVASDLSLVRACGGLFAAEAVRVSRGQGASLSAESKAAVISWTLSIFLLTGGMVAARGSSGSARGDEVALCLEAARLLTATAWDGRRGWGGDSAATIPAHRLVAGPRESSEVWAAALAPGMWRGLHAAVIGAVGSPTVQLCAFEVLEAVAASWDCGVVPADSDLSDEGGDRPGQEEEEEAGKEAWGGDGQGGGQSIVSRLAAALGGWGLASALGAGGSGAGGGGGDRGGGEEGGLEGSDEGDLPGAEAVEEEAKEQQDDLELIARCFPDDLLLAVEALPTTMDTLAEDSRYPTDEVYDGQSRPLEEGGIGEDGEYSEEEDEEDDEDDYEEEEEEEEDEEEDEGHEEEVAGGNPDNDEQTDTISHSDSSADSETEQQSNDHQSDDHAPRPAGKSRRRRLRRLRSGGGGGGGAGKATHVPGEGAGRAGQGGAGGRGVGRARPSGASLTAPFLTWLLWLEHCRRASEVESKSRSAARAFVVRARALGPVLEACIRVLKASQGTGGRGSSVESRLGSAQAIRVSRLNPRNPHDLARLALAVYFRTVHVFPALSRSWWADDCTRGLRVWVAEFTKTHVTPALIQMEAQVIADATERGIWDDGGEMTVRASATSRQVVASYVKEECTLEACIQLPPEYPLRSVAVTCTKRMGVSESRWRLWVLQIVTLLSLQDGSVLDAVMLWKKNVDKEFEGVEPCVICYGILHPRDMALPQMECKTCKNRFHSTCLYKWFHTSHKNKCPICQQTWA